MESGEESTGLHVGIKELRDGLSRYLDRVKDGSTITVTEHGRPIARIRPVGRPTKLERLIAEGRVTPARRPKGPPPEPIVLASGASVSEFVAEQRGPSYDDETNDPRE